MEAGDAVTEANLAVDDAESALLVQSPPGAKAFEPRLGPLATVDPRRIALLGRMDRVVVALADFLVLGLAAGTNISHPWLAVTFVSVCFIALAGARRSRLYLSVLDESPSVATRVLVAAVICVPLAVLVDDAEGLIWQTLASLLVVLIGRTLCYAGMRSWRTRGHFRRPTLLLGAPPATDPIARLLEDHPEFGLDVVGIHPRLPDGSQNGQRLANQVVIASGGGKENELIRALRRSVAVSTDVYVVPQPAALVPASKSRDMEVIRGIPLVRLPTYPMYRASWQLKRLFDIVVSVVALVLLSPLLAVVALGVKLSSKGAVLFRQPRVGRSRQLFAMYKFRTFPVDHVDDKFSRQHDECPLRFGRFLRRSSIDELPQLLNVLRGDMSLVGPRPERPHFANPLSESVFDYENRHRVPSGITGAAQVNGLWGDTSIEERILLDNRYIDDWSLWGDVLILLRTVPAVVRKGRS